MARQQLTEAVGIAQPLNRIAGALGRPGDDLRVERLLRVPPAADLRQTLSWNYGSAQLSPSFINFAPRRLCFFPRQKT